MTQNYQTSTLNVETKRSPRTSTLNFLRAYASSYVAIPGVALSTLVVN